MAAGSTLTATVTPSKQFANSGDELSVAKLNLLGQPTVSVSGTLANLTNVSATAGSNGQPLVWVSATGLWTPGQVGIAYVGNGSPNTSLFLRGDGNWADPTSSQAGNNLYLNQNLF